MIQQFTTLLSASVLFISLPTLAATVTSNSRDLAKLKINPAPIEFIQIDTLPSKKISFSSKNLVNSRIIVDKKDFVAGLYEIQPGEEIPNHYHRIDKSFYVLDGNAEALVKGKLQKISADDSIFVPKNNVTQIKNTSKAPCRVFFFYPTGPFASIEATLATAKTIDADLTGNGVQWVDQNKVPFEGWEGVLPAGETRPLAWKTLIDNQTMIVGNTKIDKGHDVDAHFHTQSQIVIFAGGEGKTRIKGQHYNPVKMLSAIYVPHNSVHHTVSTGTSSLKEIYFFPYGPFASVSYNKVDPITEKILLD